MPGFRKNVCVYLHFDIESIRHVKRPLARFKFYWPLWKFTLPLRRLPLHTEPTTFVASIAEKSHQTFTHFCAFQFSTRRVNRHFFGLRKLHCSLYSVIDRAESVHSTEVWQSNGTKRLCAMHARCATASHVWAPLAFSTATEHFAKKALRE